MTWSSLNNRIIECDQCPRLRDYCQRIAAEKRRAFANDTYWGHPVPNFGDPQGRILVVGLAPAAHGANRTGRMFTGDRSGEWLYRALAKAGFANQASSTSVDDGLILKDLAITAACHCAPPNNKPTREEIEACRPWFDETVDLLPVRVFLSLGNLAWKSVLNLAYDREWLTGRKPRFAHGATVSLGTGRWLTGSYHPSQQNTFTGRLTEQMLDDVIQSAKRLLQTEK